MRTVIAGYHWFTDWGRDTMISLEGLTLATGRALEAEWILRTFAHYVRDGLIPNMFPEGDIEGLYHTADATLWFFHALDRYLEQCPDKATLALMLPMLQDIVRHHLEGTHFGIKVDPRDGLLTQGAEGYQLTWMDAKVGDWVVTPRRGKAVEINALWYNALCLLADWLRAHGDPEADEHRRPCRAGAANSFNRRFWYDKRRLPLRRRRRRERRRSVVPPEPDLRDLARSPGARPGALGGGRQRGARAAADAGRAALAGAGRARLQVALFRRFARPRRRLSPGHGVGLADRPVHRCLAQGPSGRKEARAAFLAGFEPHLAEAGIGSISEVFDAEPPFTPRGCVAQAWSVAEVLRCIVKTARRRNDNAAPSGAGCPMEYAPWGHLRRRLTHLVQGCRRISGSSTPRLLCCARNNSFEIVIARSRQATKQSRRPISRLSPSLRTPVRKLTRVGRRRGRQHRPDQTMRLASDIGCRRMRWREPIRRRPDRVAGHAQHRQSSPGVATRRAVPPRLEPR